MKTLNPNFAPRKCPDCGGELIQIEVTVSTIGNNPSPITKTTYRCCNVECQSESDKRNAKKLALKREQEEARAKRKVESVALALKLKNSKVAAAQ